MIEHSLRARNPHTLYGISGEQLWRPPNSSLPLMPTPNPLANPVGPALRSTQNPTTPQGFQGHLPALARCIRAPSSRLHTGLCFCPGPLIFSPHGHQRSPVNPKSVPIPQLSTLWRLSLTELNRSLLLSQAPRDLDPATSAHVFHYSPLCFSLCIHSGLLVGPQTLQLGVRCVCLCRD